MSVRAKFHLLIFAGWFGGGFIIALVSEAHPPWIIMLIPLAVVLAFAALGMRCPNCKRRVMWQGYFMFPYLPKHCRYCGRSLSREQTTRGR